MASRASAGANQLDDAFEAGRAAAAQAVAPFEGRAPDLVIAFTTERYDQPEIIRGIRSLIAGAPLIGCCTAGVISADGPLMDGVSVLALCSDSLEVTLAIEHGVGDQPAELVERLAERMQGAMPTRHDRKRALGLMLPDGVRGIHTLDTMLRHATAAFGPLCPLLGGGSGDGMHIRYTTQFVGDTVCSDTLAMALLRTTAPIGIGVRHGWQPASRGLVVTRSSGNVVYEFDGEPALEAYREMFPSESLDPQNFSLFGLSHPLGLAQIRGEYLIRAPLRAWPDGALACGGVIPEHSVAHIMESSPASLFAAAESAAREALEALEGSPPTAVLVFSCVTRPLILGNQIKTEVEVLRKIIGHEIPISGMFSFGEIATNRGLAAAHNVTVVVCALGSE